MATTAQPAAQHSGALLALQNLLQHLTGFHALIVQHNNPQYRDQLIQFLQVSFPDSVILDLKQLGDFLAFEQAFSQMRRQPRLYTSLILKAWL
jgi:hypothetical protein